jgi:hypothetical protein
MKLNTDSHSFNAPPSTKPLDSKKTEKRLVLTDEDALQTPSRKTVSLAPKANKGLKRNLKNWEVFMEEEDTLDDDTDTGLNIEIEVLISNPTISATSSKQKN